MRTHIGWLAMALLLVTAGCEAPGDDDDDSAAPGSLVAGLSDCDSDDGTYTEPDGTWYYKMDSGETGDWRFGVSWVDLGTGVGTFYTYGCVIEVGDGQTYEWAGGMVLEPTATGATLVPGNLGLDAGVFNAALNRNLDGDNDVFQIFAGETGSATIDEFDAATGFVSGTIHATAAPSMQVEEDDVAVDIDVEFDLTWTP